MKYEVTLFKLCDFYSKHFVENASATSELSFLNLLFRTYSYFNNVSYKTRRTEKYAILKVEPGKIQLLFLGHNIL